MPQWFKKKRYERYFIEITDNRILKMRSEFMLDPPRSLWGAHEWIIIKNGNTLKVKNICYIQKENSKEFEELNAYSYSYEICSEIEPYTWFLDIDYLARAIKVNGVSRIYYNIIGEIRTISEKVQLRK